MIIFENEGEIDPRLIALVGVNVKETDDAIGFFGTGLKYAVACLSRWGEEMIVQSGANEFRFSTEEQEIRGKRFGVLTMYSRYDRSLLGFTTDLGKRWEPWMVYRELWCNARDEPGFRVYAASSNPLPKAGLTRVIVSGPRIEQAHAERDDFILGNRSPLHAVDDVLEIYEGPGKAIFYRGIAVQWPDKAGLYTYNIKQHLYLTEDRTAGSWSTDSIIAQGLAHLEDRPTIDATLLASVERLESRLDYDYVHTPGPVWLERAEAAVLARPLDVPQSVRRRFEKTVSACPTCGRPY